MLIFATVAINVAAIAIWSAVYGANGFKEVGKLIRGEAAFIPPENGWGRGATGEYGDPSGNRLGPPNPDILPDHPQVRPNDESKSNDRFDKDKRNFYAT